jgi:putative endonuclease
MFARIATRTGVRFPSPPAFARSAARAKAATPEQSVGGPTRSQCVGAARLRLGRPAFFVHDPASKAQPMNGFYYVYILVSEVDEEMHYSGNTSDLGSSLAEHNRGKCPHTAKHRPWKIETAVAFRSEAKARRFERYLKTGSGREFSRRHF